MLPGMNNKQLHRENHSNRNSLDYDSNDLDYDLNYGSIAAVHTMVRQMSSVNKMNRKHDLYKDEDILDDFNNDILDPSYHKSHSKRRRRTRIGVGDEPEIPNNVDKIYTFIHKEKVTAMKKRVPVSLTEPQNEPKNYEKKLERTVNNVNDKNTQKEDKDEDDEKYNNEKEGYVVLEVNPDEEQNYEVDKEEYNNFNPNPIFKEGDFDPLPAYLTKKPFHFEELSNEEHMNSANNLLYDKDYQERVERKQNPQEDSLLQDDMHINGRILHSSNLNGQHDRKVDRDYGDREISQMDKVVVSPNDKGVVSQEDNTIVRKVSKRQQSSKISGIWKVHRDQNSNYKQSYKRIYNTSNTYVPNVLLKGKYSRQNVIKKPSVHSENGLFIQEPPATQIQTPGLESKHGSEMLSRDGFPLVEENIYWSKQAEDFVPKGKYDSIYNIWHHRLLLCLLQLPPFGTLSTNKKDIIANFHTIHYSCYWLPMFV